jgi:hypothetical protein
MLPFLRGSDAAFAELKRRATGRCMRFVGQRLPPGAVPRNAAIGFEVDALSGLVILYVSRGVTYTGQDASVRHWLATGRIDFPTFEALVEWIRTRLVAAYVGIESGHDGPGRGDKHTWGLRFSVN